MSGIVGRVIFSLVVLAVMGTIERLTSYALPMFGAEVAGNQFANSDFAYLHSMMFMDFVRGFHGYFQLGLLAILAIIWWKPFSKMIATAAIAGLLFVSVQKDRAWAYAETTEKTEAYTILPNQSAFWVPDVGANKDTQSQFESEQYYNERKIAAKRFVIPHQKLANSGGWGGWDYYVPTGRLYIVDRAPYSREWVAQAHRGTSNRDDSFPCQSLEGLNIHAGVSIGASVSEKDAALFLANFGVKTPEGKPTDPQVIFTSVYYGRSLNDVMDDVGRKRVQTFVCDEIGKRTFDNANKDYVSMILDIEKQTRKYFADYGITINFLGWADTFTFDTEVQTAVNRFYEANKLGPVMSILEANAQLHVQEGLAKGLETKGLPIVVTPGMIDALKNLVPAVPLLGAPALLNALPKPADK